MALLPASSASDAACSDSLRHNFISCLILTAQNGFGRDVTPFLALSRETRDEEVLWDAVKDLPSFAKQRTRLMYAAKTGDVGRLRWLLARGARPEARDWLGRTALFYACEAGNALAARELLARGAAADAVAGAGLGTPLFAAAEGGHVGVVRELLAARRGRALLDAEGFNGFTPLGVALANNHVGVARELRARGAAKVRSPGDAPLVTAPMLLAQREKRLEALAAARAIR